MKKIALSFLASALVLAGCSTTKGTDEVVKPTPIAHKHSHHKHNHHKHSHDHHDHAHHGWDYKHPEHWGDLEVNKLCRVGKSQSPIDIQKVEQPLKGKVKLVEQYQPQDFKVSNNGHTIVFDVVGAKKSSVLVNGTPYHLLQFHYHIPSEHTVMNEHYPLEIHFVHQNNAGNLAVVGVLVNAGKFNQALNQIIANLPNEHKEGSLKAFNINALMPKNSKTYAYDGSLTTPPCSEQVQWLLKAKPIDASTTQLDVLAKLYNGNNRPVQPQGDRVVSFAE